MTFPPPQPVTASAGSVYAAAPRSRSRYRGRPWVLFAAIVATLVALALIVVDNGPPLAKVAERAWWWVSPSQAVSRLAAEPDFTALDLSWDANERAHTYSVSIARDAGFDVVVDRMTTSAHQVAVLDLEQGTTYFYRVSWTSAQGNRGVATRTQSVTTGIHQVSAPADIAVASTASAFSLTWAPVEWATQYVVRMSVSKDPAAFGASPADVEFPATTETGLATAAISRAVAGDHYFFTVRAANGDLSAAVSEPVSARLLLDPPKKATAVGASTTGVTISWSGVAVARKYVIERSSTPDFAVVDGSYTVPRAYRRMSVNGLAPGTPYYFRVRAEKGSRLGQASPVVTATTLSSGTVDVRVATYNVLDPALGRSLAPWSVRRKNLARTIDAAAPDIIALQEAGWSRVAGGRTPAQDLARLTKRSLSISKAGYRGDQILYSAKKYAAGDHGSFRLPRISGDGQRSAVWQIFTDRKTHARFVVVATHLTSGKSNNAGRAKQTKTILRKLRAVNHGGLPVVLMGDLNSYDARASITPMSLFAHAGYLDAEISSPVNDTPTLNTWVKATSNTGSIRFDHIAVSETIGVTRTSIENPKLSGPASDHRLLWADIAIATA
jgi:endonuclease/exonuclease/phosphatase family metal-dependent hydrolase